MFRTTTLTAILLVVSLLAAGATVGAAHSASDGLDDATASSLDDPNESDSADAPFRRVGDVPPPGDGAPGQSGDIPDPGTGAEDGDDERDRERTDDDNERDRADDADDSDGEDSDADDGDGDGDTERTRFYSNAPVNESCPSVDGYTVERVDAGEADTDLDGGENGEVCAYLPIDGSEDGDDGDERDRTRDDGEAPEDIQVENAPAGEDCRTRDGQGVRRMSAERVEERLGREVDGGENGEVCVYFPVDTSDGDDRTRDTTGGDGVPAEEIEVVNARAGEDCAEREGYAVDRAAEERVEEELGRDVDGGENGEVCVYFPEDRSVDAPTPGDVIGTQDRSAGWVTGVAAVRTD